MGTLFAFSLTSSLVLTALYLPYKRLMAGEKTFSFNRLAIIACYMVSLAAFFVMPLFHFDNARDAVANITIGEVNIDVVNEDPEQSTFGLVSILLCVYLVGVICTSGFVVWNLVCIQRILLLAEKSEICGACVNITRDMRLVPFSFGRKIVIPQSAIDSSVGLIVAHEKVHIARHHWLDLLLAQTVCVIQWYNPAAWLMMRELRAVHEFQADEGAIRQGVDIKEYQILLIKKAVGVRFPSLTNSLNHSNLKTRITMMYSNKPNGLRKLRSIALVPALGAALLVINLPAVASGLSAVTATDLPSLSDDKVKENPEPRQIHVVKHTEKSDSKEATVVAYSATAKGSVVTSGNGKGTNVSTSIDPVDGDVDVAPQYPGGEAAMLKKIICCLAVS